MQSWDEARRWRKERRVSLIARRQAIPQDERRRLQPLILDLVEQHFPELASAPVGFYWPFRGEVGLHPLVRRLIQRGARAALPVVIEKGQPLELWPAVTSRTAAGRAISSPGCSGAASAAAASSSTRMTGWAAPPPGPRGRATTC
jgi:5-formyltetrahydrofolate cyclo-ligase